MPDFDRSLPMLLNHALDAIMPAYRELFARFDLTDQQWRVLRVLWSSGKVTSVQLSQRTLLVAPSLVRILDRMEKKGLVSRVRSTSDRRVVYVVATAAGRALEAKVTPDVDIIQARTRAALSEKEWSQLENTLEKIRRSAIADSINNEVNAR